jgi:hypothetical protein
MPKVTVEVDGRRTVISLPSNPRTRKLVYDTVKKLRRQTTRTLSDRRRR